MNKFKRFKEGIEKEMSSERIGIDEDMLKIEG